MRVDVLCVSTRQARAETPGVGWEGDAARSWLVPVQSWLLPAQSWLASAVLARQRAVFTQVTMASPVTHAGISGEGCPGLAWLIRVMRLIEGLIVHRINHGARINHANCSRSPRRPQVTVTIGAMRTPVTLTSPATDGRNGCADLARVNPRDRGGRVGFPMIAKGSVRHGVLNPSGSSKSLPKRRADHDREGSLVCPD